MRTTTFAGAAALGLVVGAIGLRSTPASADLPVIDPAAIAQAVKSFAQETGILDVITAMQGVQQTISTTTTAINTALGTGTFGSVQDLLQEGFTQLSNYSKAQVGAFEQIFDASDTAMARFHRDMRNAQIRDEQTPSPAACSSLDGGVSAAAGAVQSYGVGATIAQILDKRGEAGPGAPSYFGVGQGIAATAQEHLNYYCDQNDVNAGLCAAAPPTADYDQRASSLFGNNTYPNQASVNAATAYVDNLIEPVAPPSLRGDQLASATGQDAALRRRSYNARMSLAGSVAALAVGQQAPSIPLTPLQQQYLSNIGLPPQTNGSWLQVLQIESERRISDVGWNASIQTMPPPSVLRETASEIALTNYILFQIYKMELQHTTIAATQLAETTEQNFQPTVPAPAPSLAGN